MTFANMNASVLFRGLLGISTALLSLVSMAASDFPSLSKPAIQVKASERQFMLSAAKFDRRVVAVGERGVISISEDVGSTWTQAVQVPVSTTLTAVQFISVQEGWAVGHGGVVLHTLDGGLKWEKLVDGRELVLIQRKAIESLLKASPSDKRILQMQRDAIAFEMDGPDKPLLDLYFADRSHGWVIGAYNLFFETHDGGKSWTWAGKKLNNPRLLHLNTIKGAKNEIYIAGEQGEIHYSGDKGNTFTQLKSPYRGSWFALDIAEDSSVVMAGLKGNVYRTRDKGSSWRKIEGLPPVSIVGITPVDKKHTLLGNQAGQIYQIHSSSDKATLLPLPLPPLNGLIGLNEDRILSIGYAGVAIVPLPKSGD